MYRLLQLSELVLAFRVTVGGRSVAASGERSGRRTGHRNRFEGEANRKRHWRKLQEHGRVGNHFENVHRFSVQYTNLLYVG